MSDTTTDGFLGGQINIEQPRNGFRSGIDAVLLAAAVPAKSGESVLELGCGAGAASLCLAARVPGLELTGVEISPEMAELAKLNAARNGVDMKIVEADVSDMPDEIRKLNFDHVFLNPPYFRQGTVSPPNGAAKAVAHAETETGLTAWIDAAYKRLKPKGRLTVIQKAERFADLLSALDDRLGDITLKPIAPRKGKPAELVILSARKGAKGAPRLLAPLILHKGKAHRTDGDDYRAEVGRMLRRGEALVL